MPTYKGFPTKLSADATNAEVTISKYVAEENPHDRLRFTVPLSSDRLDLLKIAMQNSFAVDITYSGAVEPFTLDSVAVAEV